jgi:hypothetical protein
MRRRDFIAFIGAVPILPRAARSQQSAKVFRIAIMHPSHPISELNEQSRFRYYREFFGGLRQLGYVEGHDLVSSVSRAKGVSRFIPNSLAMSRLAIRTLYLRSAYRWSWLSNRQRQQFRLLR